MKERMLRGEEYIGDDPDLRADHARAQALLQRYNATGEDERDLRAELLRELFGSVGDGVTVKPPLRCDYGMLVEIGHRTFVNYDCVLLDVARIEIGADCQIGPRVQLLCAKHPLDPDRRKAGWESGAPIKVGDNCWIGAGAIVLPGVELGANSVVGAGAVVTRDVPPGAVVAGNPARVLREVGA